MPGTKIESENVLGDEDNKIIFTFLGLLFIFLIACTKWKTI